jgi:hypothetical protein
MNSRFEYGGIETAKNGLTSWVQDKVIEYKGSNNERYHKACVIIVEYGVVNIPGFIKKGHAEHQAEYVAKKIHKNKKFSHFTQWVLKSRGVDLSAASNDSNIAGK